MGRERRLHGMRLRLRRPSRCGGAWPRRPSGRGLPPGGALAAGTGQPSPSGRAHRGPGGLAGGRRDPRVGHSPNGQLAPDLRHVPQQHRRPAGRHLPGRARRGHHRHDRLALSRPVPHGAPGSRRIHLHVRGSQEPGRSRGLLGIEPGREPPASLRALFRPPGGTIHSPRPGRSHPRRGGREGDRQRPGGGPVRAGAAGRRF